MKSTEYSALITAAAAKGDLDQVKHYAAGLERAIAREQDAAAADAARKNADGDSIIPANEFNRLTVDQLVEVAEKDAGLYDRSLANALAEPAPAEVAVPDAVVPGESS